MSSATLPLPRKGLSGAELTGAELPGDELPGAVLSGTEALGTDTLTVGVLALVAVVESGAVGDVGVLGVATLPLGIVTSAGLAGELLIAAWVGTAMPTLARPAMAHMTGCSMAGAPDR
jgi:hypothetical protein